MVGRAVTAAELVAWWVALFVLWLMLISTIDVLEVIVGTAVALVGAVAACAARRAVRNR